MKLHEEIRIRFKAYIADDDRYKRFIKICNKKKSIAYWQDELWKSFVVEYQEYSFVNTPTIFLIFNICHIHEKPLLTTQIPIKKGLWSISVNKEQLDLISQKAPYSQQFALDSCDYGDVTSVSVKHCPDCLKTLQMIER